ncbi:serine hydrolase [Streptomyces mirabilis]|uniref:serine hydrolase n=1 Tax=Streptomyces mirabilis TaxID=68239 RepID=UPI002E213E1A
MWSSPDPIGPSPTFDRPMTHVPCPGGHLMLRNTPNPRHARQAYLTLALAAALTGTLATCEASAASQGTAHTRTGRPGVEAAQEARLARLAQQDVDAGAPGVVVRVGKGDGRAIEIARQAPWTRADHALAASDEFRMGSNTKTMVATVVLQLVAEHRLRLTDPVEKWLPGLIPNGAAITLRMLEPPARLVDGAGVFDVRSGGRGVADFAGQHLVQDQAQLQGRSAVAGRVADEFADDEFVGERCFVVQAPDLELSAGGSAGDRCGFGARRQAACHHPLSGQHPGAGEQQQGLARAAAPRIGMCDAVAYVGKGVVADVVQEGTQHACGRHDLLRQGGRTHRERASLGQGDGGRGEGSGVHGGQWWPGRDGEGG